MFRTLLVALLLTFSNLVLAETVQLDPQGCITMALTLRQMQAMRLAGTPIPTINTGDPDADRVSQYIVDRFDEMIPKTATPEQVFEYYRAVCFQNEGVVNFPDKI